MILVEGVLLFADETLVELCDMRIFCTASEEIRYRRRLGRDVVERGRTAESVQTQWRETVMPMHRQFVEPARDTSHLVIDSEQDFDETVQSLATQIRCAVG